ncbi:MAG: bifunctional lysylphosphatidylglycerol flippase/synthetase MprF, partial [Gammaproteobacteria bacterium]
TRCPCRRCRCWRGRSRRWWSLALTALSYWVLTAYDVLGLRYVGRQLPYRRTAVTSFIAYAFGHSFSFAALTGAAVRYRLYAPSGLAGIDVARVAGFTAVTSGVGIALMGGLALVITPEATGSALRLYPGWALAAGTGILIVVAAYVAWAAASRTPLELWSWRIEPPGARLAISQLVAGLADLLLSAAALWVLLPDSANMAFPAFAGVYAAAIVVSLVSHVPGGVGVLEAMLLLTVPHSDTPTLLGALLAYRVIYYVLPLFAAALLMAALELAEQLPDSWSRPWPGDRRRVARTLDLAQRLVPQLLGSLVFFAGVVLLVSGVMPALGSRLALLGDVLPLSVLESSHLVGSVAGLGLLVLARALFEKVNAAYQLTVVLLTVGVGASLLKGLDYEEASVLGVVLLCLWLGRGQFHRRASLWQERFSPGWAISLAVVIGTATWIGLLAQRDVPYSHDLWWTFAANGDAPRMLRASLVVAVLAAGILLAELLRPAQPEPALPGPAELDQARAIILESTSALANVALAGDKHLLFAPEGDAFLMYRITGRSWVALGDPVGPRARWEELLWHFRELVDEHGGRVVFYEVGTDSLPLYLDLGLTLIKLGEEARIPLADFSLEGRPRAELRSALRRAERDDVTFEIVPAEGVAALLPALRAISDHWLDEKSAREKGFSIGAFSEAYLANFPVALVRRHGAPVAFANLWASAGREELSVDLMRFGADAPYGTMDYLFTELLLWGHAQGYRYFSLGMAPLSGLERHPLAPAWHRVGNLVFRYGEHFYNFSGLRRYKAKFLPEWQPRYLASPGGLALPRVLLDVATLIAGGVTGLLAAR